MPAESRENPLLKKGNSDAFFKEKYLTKNTQMFYFSIFIDYTLIFYASCTSYFRLDTPYNICYLIL